MRILSSGSQPLGVADLSGSLGGMRRGVLAISDCHWSCLPAAPALAAVPRRRAGSISVESLATRLPRPPADVGHDGARPGSRSRSMTQPSSPISSSPAAPRRPSLCSEGRRDLRHPNRGSQDRLPGRLRSDRRIRGIAVPAVPPHRSRGGPGPGRRPHRCPRTDDEEFSDSTRQWGWAGLGLAAAALTLVALWALPDRRRRARAAEEPERSRTRPVADRRSRMSEPRLERRLDPVSARAMGSDTVWRANSERRLTAGVCR